MHLTACAKREELDQAVHRVAISTDGRWISLLPVLIWDLVGFVLIRSTEKCRCCDYFPERFVLCDKFQSKKKINK